MIGVGIIGAGAVTLRNHLPGLALVPEARVVALCDSDPSTLERASAAVPGDVLATTDWRELIGLKYLLSRIPPTLGLPAKARGGPRNAAQNSGESAQPPRVPPGGSWRRARGIDSSVGFRGTIRPGGQDAEKCSCLFMPHFAERAFDVV